MRTGLLIALSLGIVAVGAAAAAGEREESAKAKLRLVRGAPLTLRGMQFDPHESVRLVVTARRRITKRLKANEAGSFVVGFRGLSVNRCQGFTALAVGASGSRASVTRPNVYCPPPL
jgi:hypothetical protein